MLGVHHGIVAEHFVKPPLAFARDDGAEEAAAVVAEICENRAGRAGDVGAGEGGHAIRQAGFIPCYINERAQPVPVGESAGEDATTDYVRRITEDAGLEAALAPAGGWVTFLNQ